MINIEINFNDVYKTHYDVAMNYTFNKVHNSIITEEIVNDSFLKLYKHLSSYDCNKASIKTFLFSIINNTIIDNYRKFGKGCNNISIDEINNEGKLLHQFSIDVRTPLVILCHSEMYDNIIKSINNLGSDTIIKVATLYFLNDLNYNEICETLNLSLSSVKDYIFRIRVKLQKELNNYKIYCNL